MVVIKTHFDSEKSISENYQELAALRSWFRDQNSKARFCIVVISCKLTKDTDCVRLGSHCETPLEIWVIVLCVSTS